MQEVSFEKAIDLILAKDSRYKRDAYQFVKEALDHTQKIIGRHNQGRVRHVSGQELLEGIREYALAQYGPMALMLFQEWGIHVTRDFGEIVFNMVEVGWLAKTDKDNRTDFDSGYDFLEAFRKPFLPNGKLTASGKKPAESLDL